MQTPGSGERRLLSIVHGRSAAPRAASACSTRREFLSPLRHPRAVAAATSDHPYVLPVNGHEHRVDYEPAESTTGLFGGNSNWRGPIWFPVNFLLIESLQKFHHYFGRRLPVECPTGSGQIMTLGEVAAELSQRLSRIFLRDADGPPAGHRRRTLLQTDPHWRDLVPFYEYFHGDTGCGRRREPPDRLDGARRETAAAGWPIVKYGHCRRPVGKTRTANQNCIVQRTTSSSV